MKIRLIEGIPQLQKETRRGSAFVQLGLDPEHVDDKAAHKAFRATHERLTAKLALAERRLQETLNSPMPDALAVAMAEAEMDNVEFELEAAECAMVATLWCLEARR